MGLAASQARLLFITMRQNDVSAKMQRISNENLILARDAEDLDNKYKQMKNRETYQVGGVDLSYDALMGSQAVTNGNLILLQNAASGAVVLSPSLGSKLGLEGVGNGAAFKSKFGDQTAFIAKMTGMSADSVRTILTELNSTTNTQTPKSDDKSVSVDDILNYFNQRSSFYEEYNQSELRSGTFNNMANGTTSVAIFGNAKTGWVGGYFANTESTGYENGWQNEREVPLVHADYSIKDLYNLANNQKGMVWLGTTTTNSPSSISSQFSALTAQIGNSILEGLSNEALGLDRAAVKTALDGVINSVNSSYISGGRQAHQCTTAEYSTNAALANHYYGSTGGQSVLDDSLQKYNENALAIAMTMGKEQHCVVCASSYKEDTDKWQFVVNAGNVVKDILDGLMIKMTNGGVKEDTSLSYSANTNSTGVDRTRKGTILAKYFASGETETPKAPDEVGKANVQFYKNMYNTMAVYGYQVDEKVNTSSYLNEKLQNNQYCINGKPVGESNVINKKVDESVKEEAQEFYDMEMAKIKRKEKQLDNDMTKLQTEYSALTNDYNSVKGLVDANIQRSFTYCSQG